MTVGMALPDWLGFDANAPLSDAVAAAMVQHGYRFAVRYVRREPHHDYDLTSAELQRLLGAGLAVGAAQHVESAESWVPTPDKGQRYGETAAQEAQAIGLARGVTLWCDLEGVASDWRGVPTVPAAETIGYCNRWYSAVLLAGYLPGLYVGWHAGLSAYDLYFRLNFTRYWSAYNLNVDQYPVMRGPCMKQRAAKNKDIPSGSGFSNQSFDVDTVVADAKQGLPTFHMPDV